MCSLLWLLPLFAGFFDIDPAFHYPCVPCCGCPCLQASLTSRASGWAPRGRRRRRRQVSEAPPQAQAPGRTALPHPTQPQVRRPTDVHHCIYVVYGCKWVYVSTHGGSPGHGKLRECLLASFEGGRPIIEKEQKLATAGTSTGTCAPVVCGPSAAQGVARSSNLVIQ